MTPEREISFAFIAVRPDRRLRGFAESEATNLPLILRARPKIGVWHIRVLRGAEKAPHGGDQGPSFRARDGCCLEVFGEATGGGRNMRRRARRPSVEALPLSGRTGPNVRVGSKAPVLAIGSQVRSNLNFGNGRRRANRREVPQRDSCSAAITAIQSPRQRGRATRAEWSGRALLRS